MSELILALRRLLRGREPRTPPALDDLDRERAASMADEGGAAGARVEAPESQSRRVGAEPQEPPSRRARSS
jgi:hypothetical protein